MGGVLDGVQMGLDVLGMVPAFGEIADGINGLIYAARGDYVNAGLSFAAMLPFAGWAATAGKFARKSSSAAGLFRKTKNTGVFSRLNVPMQHRVVKDAAARAGVGLQGVKVTISRQSDYIGRGLYGYAHPNGKQITLYPDAFSDYETLVRTLGHERTHLFQFRLYGPPSNSSMSRLMEEGAYGIENSFWDYYRMNR